MHTDTIYLNFYYVIDCPALVTTMHSEIVHPLETGRVGRLHNTDAYFRVLDSDTHTPLSRICWYSYYSLDSLECAVYTTFTQPHPVHRFLYIQSRVDYAIRVHVY